jgi:hypothetical protein
MKVIGELRKLHNVFFTRYSSGDRIKKEQTGRACGTYGEEEKYLQGFGR